MALDGSLRVTDQWKIDGELFAEFLQCFQAVTADAQNLGIKLFIGCQLLLKSLQFTLSDRGEGGIVEGQYRYLALQNRRQTNLALGGLGREQRGFLADLQGLCRHGRKQQ